jgi:hypothetical protein
MERTSLEMFADICVVILTIVVAVLAILGILTYSKVSTEVRAVKDLSVEVRDAAESISGIKGGLEAGTNYNLKVGFYDPEAKTDPQLKDTLKMKPKRAADIELRVWNVVEKLGAPKPEEDEEAEETAETPAETFLGTKRADWVSCTVEFPPEFDVAVPRAARDIDAKVTKRKVTLSGGRNVVSIDYGGGLALHPGTYFAMMVRVTPRELGEYKIKVTADAANPYSSEPAYQMELRLVVEK